MKKLLVLATACAAAVVGFAKTITVTSTADTFPDAAEGSLRAALAAAEDGDTITFADDLGTITIVGVSAAQADTSLVIDKAITIEGNGVTIDGGWDGMLKSAAGGRIFLIPAGVGKVTVKNLKMQNGHGCGWYSPINAYFQGGAMCALSPVLFENCQFVRCVSADCNTDNLAPTIRGGGAIYSESDVEAVDCEFKDIVGGNGNSSYGGVILSKGGSLSVIRATVTGCRSGSYGGGFLYGENMNSLVINDVTFDGTHANHTGGAFQIDGCTTMIVERCRFVGCYAENGNGGVAMLKGSGQFVFRDCEFSDCYAECGGAVRADMSRGFFVNCTLHNCSGNQWGPTLDLRKETYLINCTLVGSMSCASDEKTAGVIFSELNAARLLNTVMAFGFLNAAGTPTLSNDLVPLSGSYVSVSSAINGQIHGMSKDDVVAETGLGSTALFADALTTIKSGSPVGNKGKKLAADVDIPTLAEIGENRSRVVDVKVGGPLDGTGYPVRVNEDYTWIQYSVDGGKSWTDLYKNGTPATQPVLIASDQRGIEYYEGLTPIGAATFVPDPTVPRFHLAIVASETNATITVKDVYIGEDATSYDVWASVDGSSMKKVLGEQSAATASFETDNLPVGIHTSQVFVVNNANITSSVKVVSFRVIPPNTRIVTDPTDDVASPAPGSFRAVLAEAKDGETIVFDEPLRGAVITIVGVDSVGGDTSLVIDKAVTIDGNGVTISGGWVGAANDSTGGRIFLVPAGVSKVTIQNMVMKNGHGRGWSVAGDKYFQGGAMCALSPVRFENCVFWKNTAADATAFAPTIRGGGAIYAESDVEVIDCVFGENSILTGSTSYGGAICMKNGSLLVEGTAVTNCLSESYGGGFFYGQDLASVTVRDSTFYKVSGKSEGGAFWIKSCPVVTFEGCSFENASGNKGGVFQLGETGSANAACASVVIKDCSFKNCSASSQGGSVFMRGGSLLIEGVSADGCQCNDQAGFFYGQDMTSLVLRDSVFNGNHARAHAGAFRIYSCESAMFERTRFVGCYAGSWGGACLVGEGGACGRTVLRDCEFMDCSAGCGGAIRAQADATILFNCTFTGSATEGDSWGPALDSRNNTYCINCTFSGNMFTDNYHGSSGGFAACSYNGKAFVFLNTVGAFNYNRAAADASGDLESGKDFYTNGIFYNTVCNGKAADSTTLTEDSPLFSAYETIERISFKNTTIALREGVKVPVFEPDEKGKYRSCVIGIEKDGLLDGTGWPVKVNADYSHICYSADKGATWTDLYKAEGADDSTLALVTADQRGVPYRKGKTPIGAATIEPTAGMYLIIR